MNSYCGECLNLWEPDVECSECGNTDQEYRLDLADADYARGERATGYTG